MAPRTTIGPIAFHSSGELTRLMNLFSGYDLFGLQAEPGQCSGHLEVGVVSPIAFVITYTVSQDMLFSGLRSMDHVCFAAAPPLNSEGAQTVPWFWKNKTLPRHLVGGFDLTETVSHYKISRHHQHVCLFVDRKALMAQLDQPKNRTVLEYMSSANSCVLPEKCYWDFVHYVLVGAFFPQIVSFKECPILSVLDVLNDGSYAHALPSAQLLPSSTQLLKSTRTLKQDILGGINVTQFGEIAGLGRTQLNTACQEVYSCSPKQLLRSIRLEEAMLLLRSPAERSFHGLSTITDIHNYVGIQSGSAFRKAFSEWFLTTPKSCWVD